MNHFFRTAWFSLHLVYLGGCTGQVLKPDEASRRPGTGAPGAQTPGGNEGGGGSEGNPGGGGEAGGETKTPLCVGTVPPLQASRVWRLTHTQFKNTLLAAFGFTGTAVNAFPADGSIEGFANASSTLAVSSLLFENYAQSSEEIAAEVVRRSAEFLPCALGELGNGTCLADYLNAAALKTWRRPPTNDEVSNLTGLYKQVAQVSDPATGLKTVVQALVLSPNFVYRTELGDNSEPGRETVLTDFEIGEAMSYALWDGPPDQILLDLAKENRLHETADLAVQAKRMFAATDRASASLNDFMGQWAQIDKLRTLQKDATAFPQFTPQLVSDILGETRLFIDEIVFGNTGDKSLKTILTSPVGYVNSRTAELYGVDSDKAELTRTALGENERRGILTQASFLTAHSNPDSTGLVERGKFVRQTLLCDHVPPPPGDFKFDPTKITPDMTAREKFDIHAKNPACATCHHLFDGIGFALENYDPIGRYRTTEHGKTIDPSGDISLPSGSDLKFDNFIDLIDQLSNMPAVYGCFASQYLSYASGRPLKGIAVCEVDAIAEQFAQGGYTLDSLVVAIVSSHGFISRQN